MGNFEIKSKMHSFGNGIHNFFDHIHDLIKNGGHVSKIKVVHMPDQGVFHKHGMPEEDLSDIDLGESPIDDDDDDDY